MSKKIPERWEEYASVGKKIAGTRFVAFKVPLSARFTNIPDSERFTPQHLFQKLKEHGLTLGLLVDLTNTTRYYNKQEVEEEGVEYIKLFTEGKAVPSTSVRQRFAAAVEKFTVRNKDNDYLIGVHCTHGVNRSGYLICRYMIDWMGFEAKAAITAFNEARGHSIERPNYLADLKGEPYEDPKVNDRWQHQRKQNVHRMSRGGYQQAQGQSWRQRMGQHNPGFHNENPLNYSGSSYSNGPYARHRRAFHNQAYHQQDIQQEHQYNHQPAFLDFQVQRPRPFWSHHQQNCAPLNWLAGSVDNYNSSSYFDHGGTWRSNPSETHGYRHFGNDRTSGYIRDSRGPRQ